MMVCRWQFHSNPDWAALSLDKVELIVINQACNQSLTSPCSLLPSRRVEPELQGHPRYFDTHDWHFPLRGVSAQRNPKEPLEQVLFYFI